jgi:hypothetical protein
MCRSIVRLRDRDEMASDEAVRAAALQFVRKISGYRAPSARNQAAFDEAVDEISKTSHRLLEAITGGHAHHHAPHGANDHAAAKGA